MPSHSQFVYVGSWDVTKSTGGTGIGVCLFDPESGRLSLREKVFPDITVGACCRHPVLPILYFTDECATLPGYFQGGGGQVFALAADSRTGALTEINHIPSFGTLPSYVAVDSQGEYLVLTNHTGRVPATKVVEEDGKYRIALEYDDAATVLFPLNPDGSIAPPSYVHKHSGEGGPLPRQTHPQLHSVTMSPSGHLFVVCDKGNDEVVAFHIDRATRKLRVCGTPLKTFPGSSPRYTAAHPEQPYFFLNHETKAVVTSIHYDDWGNLVPVCHVSVLPDHCQDSPDIKQSDVKIHPNGKFLYCLIRGLNMVSVFDIHRNTGMLERKQSITLDGHGPRGCAISPDGRFLLVAALTSNQVVVWSIAEDGTLSPTGNRIDWRNPGSITFAHAGAAYDTRPQI